jgi:hypothetical protein
MDNQTTKSRLTAALENARSISENVSREIYRNLLSCGVPKVKAAEIAKSAKKEVYEASMRESRELHRRFTGRELEQG